MPPRSIVAVILAFWLAADGWLIYREVWPYLRAGDPPPYTIDLTEELGNASVTWDILKKDQKIGYAVSQVHRQRDRSYKLHMEFRFDQMRILILNVRKLTGDYVVTEDGELRGMAAHAWITTSARKVGEVEMELEMAARVENGALVPELFINNEKLALGEVRIPMTERSATINPMHPLHRLPGLHEGRRWRIALFDPMSAIGKALGPQFNEVLGAMEGMTGPELHAEVKSAMLNWNDEEVPCFKIEYRKPSEADPVAATWVRRRDGLVLQQHSSHGFAEMTLRRKPVK